MTFRICCVFVFFFGHILVYNELVVVHLSCSTWSLALSRAYSVLCVLLFCVCVVFDTSSVMWLCPRYITRRLYVAWHIAVVYPVYIELWLCYISGFLTCR